MEEVAVKPRRTDAVSKGEPRFTAEYLPDAGLDALVSRFNEDGYLVIEDAVSAQTIDRVREAADRIVAAGAQAGRWQGKPETAPRRVEYRGIFNLDEAFMELLAP